MNQRITSLASKGLFPSFSIPQDFISSYMNPPLPLSITHILYHSGSILSNRKKNLLKIESIFSLTNFLNIKDFSSKRSEIEFLKSIYVYCSFIKNQMKNEKKSREIIKILDFILANIKIKYLNMEADKIIKQGGDKNTRTAAYFMRSIQSMNSELSQMWVDVGKIEKHVKEEMIFKI